MLDVIAEQLLVLLLVVYAQLDAARRFFGYGLRLEAIDRFLHMCAICEDRVERWTREGRAQLLVRLDRDIVVIAVEQPEKIRIVGAIAGQVFAQDERLEEPGGVGQVPLGGTGLGTALHHHVFG